jgi:beta-1,4-mannosyl-glycoprotein beta-1,4-N-acetylglucosaminyltransferase
VDNLLKRFEVNKFFFKNKNKYKIYDCFLFLNENDLLEIRLNELSDVVDYFIIVESKLTFTKHAKPFNFDIQRFAKFKDQIIYIQDEQYIKSPNPWETEKYQRNKLIEGLNLPYLDIKASQQDLIILSDLDEIPKKESIKDVFFEIYKNNKKYVKLNLKSFRYAINNQMITDQEWAGPTCTKRIDISTMQELRKENNAFYIKNSGWHYSWMGNPEDIIYKLRSYSHKENDKWPNNDVSFIKERISKGYSCLGHEECLFKIIDLNKKNCSKYVLKNKEKYDKLIFKHEKSSIWAQITSLYHKKVCEIKEYSLGIRNKSSKKIN